MSQQIIHSHIQDASLMHQPFNYVQSADPGAVGAGLFWLDTTNANIDSTVTLKWRNDANDGWVSI